MFIKSIKLSKRNFIATSSIFVILILLILGFFIFKKGLFNSTFEHTVIENTEYVENVVENNTVNQNNEIQNTTDEKDTSYIKWFEFNVSYNVLLKTYNLDISSHNNNEAVKYNWIELISYLACKYKKYEKLFLLL